MTWPGVYYLNLNGPVPMHFARSAAGGTCAGKIGEYPEATIIRREGCGRRRRKITVKGSGVSIVSMFAYHSLRGFSRSLAGASFASRTMSNVYLTSLAVNDCPSCQRTFFRRKKTRL